MNQYYLGRKARADLRKIWKYVAKDQSTRADELIDSFFENFRLIAMNPEIGEARPKLRKGLRILSAGKFVIGYRRVTGGISIIRVVHGARNWTSLF